MTLVPEGEILAIALFAACLYHSWQKEGRRQAQQWFAFGYIFALLRNLLLVQLGVVLYSDQSLQFGGAPTLFSLFIPAFIYISYLLTNRLAGEKFGWLHVYLISILTPALILPLDATALQLGWWTYPSGSVSFLNGVPYFAPMDWGLTAALFAWVIMRVRKIRFRGSGQLYALVIAAPLVAGLDILLVAIAQIAVNLLAIPAGGVLLNVGLALLFFGLPVALFLGKPFSGKPVED